MCVRVKDINYGKNFTDYSFLFSKYIDLILSYDKSLTRDLIDILHVSLSVLNSDGSTFDDNIADLRVGYKKLYDSVSVSKTFEGIDVSVILGYRDILAKTYTEYIRQTINVFVMPVEINNNYMINNGMSVLFFYFFI